MTKPIGHALLWSTKVCLSVALVSLSASLGRADTIPLSDLLAGQPLTVGYLQFSFSGYSSQYVLYNSFGSPYFVDNAPVDPSQITITSLTDDPQNVGFSVSGAGGTPFSLSGASGASQTSLNMWFSFEATDTSRYYLTGTTTLMQTPMIGLFGVIAADDWLGFPPGGVAQDIYYNDPRYPQLPIYHGYQPVLFSPELPGVGGQVHLSLTVFGSGEVSYDSAEYRFSQSPTEIPEPGSLLLLTTGFAFLLAFRRKRK